MRDTNSATNVAETRSTTIAVRIPEHLRTALERAAARDGNPLSAAARRLLSLGLEAEAQALARRGAA
jgi:hypothetical protein